MFLTLSFPARTVVFEAEVSDKMVTAKIAIEDFMFQIYAERITEI